MGIQLNDCHINAAVSVGRDRLYCVCVGRLSAAVDVQLQFRHTAFSI